MPIFNFYFQPSFIVNNNYYLKLAASDNNTCGSQKEKRGKLQKTTLRYKNVRFASGVDNCAVSGVKHDIYGKQQTVSSCVSQKHEYLRFSTCLYNLLRRYLIHLVNKQ